ncbi:MAG: DUF3237 domain-containing protein [Terracidiphilus sp.]|jgi:hypothetical protein
MIRSGGVSVMANWFNLRGFALLPAVICVAFTPCFSSAQTTSRTAVISDAAPKLELAFEEIVMLDKSVTVGDTAYGHRQFVPITGGSVSGPRLKGRVLPGGWDWQLLLSNGCMSLSADYKLQAEDGTIIYVSNKGLLCGGDGGRTFTRPVFEAPKGAYDWLTTGTFVGVLSGAGDADHPAVRITFYQVK